MKANHRCPKCGADDVIIADFKTGPDATDWNYIPLTRFKGAVGVRHVCCICGYSEVYYDKKILADLRETYGN